MFEAGVRGQPRSNQRRERQDKICRSKKAENISPTWLSTGGPASAGSTFLHGCVRAIACGFQSCDRIFRFCARCRDFKILTCRGRSHGRGTEGVVCEWKRLELAKPSDISLSTLDELGRAIDFVDRSQLLDSCTGGGSVMHICFSRKSPFIANEALNFSRAVQIDQQSN